MKAFEEISRSSRRCDVGGGEEEGISDEKNKTEEGLENQFEMKVTELCRP